MPRAVRRRQFQSEPERVWEYATNPRNLPRWWPRTASVRALSGTGNQIGSRWTQCLAAKSGNKIEANLICTRADAPGTWRFEQRPEDTPFEKMLKEAWTELRIAAGPNGTSVELELGQKLQGMARLGALFVRSASAKTAQEALGNLAAALDEPGEGLD